MHKNFSLSLWFWCQKAIQKGAALVEKSRPVQFFYRAEARLNKTYTPKSALEDAALGFVYTSAQVFKLGLAVVPLAFMVDGYAQPGRTATSTPNDDITNAINQLGDPAKKGACAVRNAVVPILFVLSIVSIAIGGILKALQNRAAGNWLIGGLAGVAFSVLLFAAVGVFIGSAYTKAGMEAPANIGALCE